MLFIFVTLQWERFPKPNGFRLIYLNKRELVSWIIKALIFVKNECCLCMKSSVSLRMWGKLVLNSSFGKEQLTHSFANVLDVIEKRATTWHCSIPSQSFFYCSRLICKCRGCQLLLLCPSFICLLFVVFGGLFCSFDFGVRHAKHTSVPLNSTSDRISLLIAFAVFLSCHILHHCFFHMRVLFWVFCE